MSVERALNTILEVSGRKPFSKVELGTALPILTHAVNEELAAQLEAAERERDAHRKLQIEELHMVGNQIDARLKGDPWVVMAFAQAWVDYFKDMGAENFVVVGVKHVTFGDFEVVMKKAGSKSPYHVAGEAVARAKEAEAALRTLREASAKGKVAWMDSLHFSEHLENDGKPQQVFVSEESLRKSSQCIDKDGYCTAQKVLIFDAENLAAALAAEGKE